MLVACLLDAMPDELCRSGIYHPFKFQDNDGLTVEKRRRNTGGQKNRAIATPKAVNAMQMSFTPTVERLARRMFPGQVPAKLVSPEPYEHDTFTLEGHELRIIEQGRTDSPDSTSLYVPSIGLIVAGDVVYNQCRIYVGDTTPESRKNWIAALDAEHGLQLIGADGFNFMHLIAVLSQQTSCSGSYFSWRQAPVVGPSSAPGRRSTQL